MLLVLALGACASLMVADTVPLKQPERTKSTAVKRTSDIRFLHWGQV